MLVCGNKHAAGESDENFVGQIITGDETWVYRYDPETKCQSSQWKSADSPRPKKARQVLSKVKVVLIVFFDMEGIVHFEYVPQGQTVNQQFYLHVLKRLRLAVSRKRTQKLAADPGRYITTMCQHTQHIPSRYFWQVMAFLSFINHPAPLTWLRVTFGCSPQLKTVLKGKRFEDIDTIKQNATSTPNTIPKDSFKNVSSSGRTARSSVSVHKESILKIMKYF